jgi:hypothetical protein
MQQTCNEKAEQQIGRHLIDQSPYFMKYIHNISPFGCKIEKNNDGKTSLFMAKTNGVIHKKW